jgi:putative (di)nucleoside polyphosphate hydrolase
MFMNNKIKIKKLPLRNNVAAVIFKDDKFLLIQREDWLSGYWKFPQGGVEEGENEEEALKRELFEEIGTDKFKIIGKSKTTNSYDWDDYSIEKAEFKWRGQFQKFYLVEFLGENKDLKLSNEIKFYKWAKKNDLKLLIDHDKKNYKNYYFSIKKVLKEF